MTWTARTLGEVIGKEITITDKRTQCQYKMIIRDARESFGNLRILVGGEKFFQPTDAEVSTIARGMNQIVQ